VFAIHHKISLLRCRLETGRTHQIRVHLSSIKHPVVGDTLYGAPARITGSTSKQILPVLDRNFLHSAFLQFLHPRTQQTMSFSSDLPVELRLFLNQVRKLDGDS
jgi:23S rRNA pseudouridine1911/1915/1917 synthase